MEISFVVPGVPIPQGSMRGFVRGGKVRVTSDNAKLRNWRQMIAGVAFAKMSIGNVPMLMGPVRVEAIFYLPRPQSVSVRALPIKRPDLDKLTRAVLDGMTDGGVFHDDSQVVHLVVEKQYAVGVGPRCEVTVHA
jgi:Holliday junction resolvase RusA-like endonuclease